MFRHTGKGRNYTHNLKLASILSAVAGMVNITGVMVTGTLTTNVTGHFAFFSEVLFLRDYSMAAIYILYVLSFLFGAFFSGLLAELMGKKRNSLSYFVPISVEIAILVWGALLYGVFPHTFFSSPVVLSLSLLFAMGLQNALVTRISQSVVRTTHLTGLFTDLGIELSQLVFYRGAEKKMLWGRIFLKLVIIFCFFLGCILGGFLYLYVSLKVLLFPAALLLFSLWYDRFLFRYYHLKRKFRH